MTADVASLTACVVVDCCSKTRDSNTPHIWPRRVDPAGQAGRARELSESAHLECFHPFKGSQPPLRPLARPYLTQGGHGGLVTTAVWATIIAANICKVRGLKSAWRGAHPSWRATQRSNLNVEIGYGVWSCLEVGFLIPPFLPL